MMSCIGLNLITAVLLPLGGAAGDGWNFYQISQCLSVYISARDLAVRQARVCVSHRSSKHHNVWLKVKENRS